MQATRAMYAECMCTTSKRRQLLRSWESLKLLDAIECAGAVSNSDHAACTARTSRCQRLIVRAADAAAAADEPARSIDGMAKAIGGAQVNKQSVLVVGATGTLGRQVWSARPLALCSHTWTVLL